jgi:hypothetical protein
MVKISGPGKRVIRDRLRTGVADTEFHFDTEDVSVDGDLFNWFRTFQIANHLTEIHS